MKQIPSSELMFSFSRSSGPGGQNVNKVSTKVTLKWNLYASSICSRAVIERFEKKYGNRMSQDGVVVLTSDSYRSQPRNKAECIAKLNEMLDSVWLPEARRRKTKPTKSRKSVKY